MKQVDKEKYNKIIDEAYQNYNSYMTENFMETRWCKVEISPDGKSTVGRIHTKDEFIHECKTNLEFSQTWDLRIEEIILQINGVPTEMIKVTCKDEVVGLYQQQNSITTEYVEQMFYEGKVVFRGGGGTLELHFIEEDPNAENAFRELIRTLYATVAVYEEDYLDSLAKSKCFLGPGYEIYITPHNELFEPSSID